MLVCKEAARLISDSHLRPLRWRERAALWLHLTVCDACTRFKQQMRLLTDAVRRFEERQPMEVGALRLSDDARQRIRIILADQSPD